MQKAFLGLFFRFSLNFIFDYFAGATDRSGGRGGPPPAAPPQDYGMLLRQQEYEHRMAHHSGK